MVDQTTSFDMMQPETIAKEYGGSKQKIALAMQQGLVDPTAGTLAGMFIDRMRSRDMLGQGAPPTVVQQVFAPPQQQQQGAPPQPGGPGAMPPQQGMGGPPTGMGGPPPEGAMIAPPMQGLTDLPVPDQMFGAEQPSMAGGGLVAFAGGGSTIERMVPITSYSESRNNPNAVSHKGAKGLMQIMPATGRDPGYGVDAWDGSKEDNLRFGTDYLNAMMNEFGGDPAKAWAAYNAGPDATQKAIKKHGKNWLSKMLKETRDYVATNTRALDGKTNEKPLTTDQAATGLPSLEPGIASEYVGEYKQMVPRDYTNRDELMAALAKERSPEAKKAQKDQDMWSMLAQVGFGTAAGKSGNFLTDLGSAANAALPAAQEATAARKASDMETLNAQVALEASGNADLERDAGVGIALYKSSVDNLLRKELTDQEDQLRRDGMKQEEILAGRQQRATAINTRLTVEASKPQTQRAADTIYNVMRDRQRENYKTYENGKAAAFGLFKKNGNPKTESELRAMALQAAMDQETRADIAKYEARPSQQPDNFNLGVTAASFDS